VVVGVVGKVLVGVQVEVSVLLLLLLLVHHRQTILLLLLVHHCQTFHLEPLGVQLGVLVQLS